MGLNKRRRCGLACVSIPGINSDVVDLLQTLCGVRFSLDFTGNIPLPDASGHTSLVHVPSDQLKNALKHYRKCKALSPHNTSACVLVPSEQKSALRSLLQGMQCVTELGVGFHLSSSSSQGPLLAPVQVWFDSTSNGALRPCVSKLSVEALDNMFSGVFAGAPVRIMIDTGASHDFAHPELIKRLGLAVAKSQHATAQLADGSAAPIFGVARSKLVLGSFSADISVLQLSAMPVNTDLIIGLETLKKYRAVLDLSTSSLTLHKGLRAHRVLSDLASATPESVIAYVIRALDAKVFPVKPVLTAKQANRALKHGAHAMLAFLKPDGSVSAPAATRKVTHNFMCAPKCCSAGSVSAEETGLIEDSVLQDLLSEYSDVFQDLPHELSPERGTLVHTIPLEQGARPPFRNCYRLSPSELLEVKAQITDLLAKGFIEPSTSPFGAPILFVAKKDGGLRMCVDYRALNKLTVRNRYPLPRIEDLLDRLSGCSVFSSFDLQSGYHQLRITSEDVPKTAFTTPLGHFQYKVLCFGLTNAPATFQSVMNRLFAPYIDKFVVVYLDDILVYSRNPEEHLSHLRFVLEVLRREKLFAKLSKCSFNKAEILYLGHVVGKNGLRPDPKKSSVVRNWPKPAGVSELRSFLGLSNYFRRFIQGYSSLVSPLTDLCRADVRWLWTPGCQQAFEGVKQALADSVLLALPDFSRPFELISDASLLGTGAVLLQDGRPIAFTSKKFIPAERNYITSDQELLGVIHALKEWRCYLEGPEMVLVTDHHPLTHLQTQPTLSRRQARWMEFLSRFHYVWEHRPGRCNVADPISRNPALAAVVVAVLTRSAQRQTDTLVLPSAPELSDVDSVCEELPSLLRDITAAYRTDPWFNKPQNVQSLHLRQDGVYLKTMTDRSVIVVPNSAPVKQRILFELHDAHTAGHPGQARTLELVQRYFWWPAMTSDVAHYVSHCSACQHNKPLFCKFPVYSISELKFSGKVISTPLI